MWFGHLHSTKEVPYGLFILHVQLDSTIGLKHFEKKAKEKGATKIISEEIYDWNIGFFLKNGYKIAGELKDLPKGHSFFIVEKDL